jgi:primosomal protein N' (replication factor Y)
MCHYCGYSEPLPDACPECGGALEYVGVGTQRVEEALHQRFPGVEVIRMDADTTTASRSHEKLLTRFRTEKVPILVGTQMVAKGLDFENVTLVGVVAADQTLYVDDLRAAERTFSLLTQVVGRAGRGSKSGRALIQTYTPDNEVIRCAARQDYDSFYEEEIQLRQLRSYPPFENMFVFTASGLEEDGVLRTCLRLRQELTRALDSGEYQSIPYRLLGPAPAAVVKVNERYRYRLTLGAQNQKKLRDLIAHLLRQAQRDKVNRGVSIFVDVDPLD